MEKTLENVQTEPKKRIKYCGFCRNHDVMKLEKGHKQEGCPNKQCDCKKCKATRQKGYNTKAYRGRKKIISALSSGNNVVNSNSQRTIEKYKHKYFMLIPGSVFDEAKILSQVFRCNDLDTSKWVILDKQEVDGGFEANFEIDQISHDILKEKECQSLKFGTSKIKFGLVEAIDEEMK
ncbi:uncharacterized protein [Chironomus tepperi]|uniref:uncharacterized protein isoform X2 n=1 Tax=Chironomus tepperi TaxID=113505 RepID=UPI00391F727F